MKEQELYQPVKKLLETAGYQVYAEVSGIKGNWSARADIIAYNRPASCIVEMKTSLTMDLLEQVENWTGHANYIYIAIPKRKKVINAFVDRILSRMRVGVIEVDTRYGTARISRPARFNRTKYKHDWKKILLPEHQTWVEAGGNGGHVTPYKLTIDKARGFLRMHKNRWVTIDEILKTCETHYASPKPSLSKALREFEHGWCESKIIKRKLHFRYKG